MPVDAAALVASSLAAADTTDASGERHDSLVTTQKKPLKTVLDSLNACTSEFKSDRFWADLAKPIDKAIEKFREHEAALTIGEHATAAEARSVAVMCLDNLDEQMQQASNNNLFLNEAKMVRHVRDVMKFDESIRLDSPLNSMAEATHAMLSEGAKERQFHASKNQTKLEAVRMAMKPYEFEHAQDSCEMTVKVRVPPSTMTRDVKCHISRDAIKVCVAGHTLQPSVIDGKLQHPVDPAACDWHLEGKGDSRQVVIDLEKVSGGLDWQDLLQPQLGYGQVL